MGRPWYEYIATLRSSPQENAPAKPEYLFPGEESPSPAADQLVDDFRALSKQIFEKYGEQLWELPYEEWVIWRGLVARVSTLPDAEQRYVFKRLGSTDAEK